MADSSPARGLSASPGSGARSAALQILAKAGDDLTEPEAKQVLACYGIQVPREGIALSASATATLARQIGFPVALKVVSPNLRAKRAAGALALGVKNAAEVRVAFARVLQHARKHDAVARLEGVLVSEMVPRGIDVTLSFSRGRGGALVTFGLGGLLGVAAGGAARRPAGEVHARARTLLHEVAGIKRVIDAYGDANALCDLLERFATLALEMEEISAFALDVHALGGKPGYVVVDASATRARRVTTSRRSA